MAVSAIDLYKDLLPKTNCGECGYPSCFAFASIIILEKLDLAKCPYVDGDKLSEYKKILAEQFNDGKFVKKDLAADALVAAGPDAVPPLLNIMEYGPQKSRLEAVRALALLEDHRAIPVLFHALDDESALVTHWADQGPQRMGVGMTFFKPVKKKHQTDQKAVNGR